MPVTRVAQRALRKSERKYIINVRRKRSLKDILKEARETRAVETIRQAISQIDKAVKNHLLHQNKAGHLKSQLMKAMKPAAKTAGKKTAAKKAAKAKSPKKKS